MKLRSAAYNHKAEKPYLGANLNHDRDKATVSVIPWIEQQYGYVKKEILDNLNRGRSLQVTAELMGISTTTLERLNKHYNIKRVVVWK